MRLSTILALLFLIHSRSRMACGKSAVLCLAWYALCLSAWEAYLASFLRLRLGFSNCSGLGRLRRHTSTRQYLQQNFARWLLTIPRVPFGPFLQHGFEHKQSAGLSSPPRSHARTGVEGGASEDRTGLTRTSSGPRALQRVAPNSHGPSFPSTPSSARNPRQAPIELQFCPKRT